MAMFWPMLPTKADPGFRVMWRVSENGGYLILGSCFLSGSYYMRVPYFRKLPCAGTCGHACALTTLGQEASFLGQRSSLLGLL